MKLVHIHMHFPWALLSLNLGQVFNPQIGFFRGGEKNKTQKTKNKKTTLPIGTAPRQTLKSSSLMNTKPNLDSHISSHNDRKYLVSVLEIQEKKLKTGVPARAAVKGN